MINAAKSFGGYMFGKDYVYLLNDGGRRRRRNGFLLALLGIAFLLITSLVLSASASAECIETHLTEMPLDWQTGIITTAVLLVIFLAALVDQWPNVDHKRFMQRQNAAR